MERFAGGAHRRCSHPVKLTWSEVTAWRLDRHFLTTPAPKGRWLEVVTAIGGLHAQLMSAAALALAIRLARPDDDVIPNALWRDRTLVKTWAMRGTLHLVAARDLPELTAALATLRHFRRPSWLRYFKVTEQNLDAILAASREILTDRGIPREALADALAERAKQPKLRRYLRSGWGTLLKPVAFQGHLCFGPSDGQLVTFVNPRRWLGSWKAVPAAEAYAALARRYLSAYGPARSDDFARWLGVDVATARRLFKELGDDLAEVTVGDWKGSMLRSDLHALERNGPPAPPPARLLPFFDPYTVAVSRQSQFLFPPKHRSKVYRPQGWISPVVLIDGRVAGVWRQPKTKGDAVITIEPFAPLTRTAKAAVAAEALRCGLAQGPARNIQYTY